jgi:hypothetical protein
LGGVLCVVAVTGLSTKAAMLQVSFSFFVYVWMTMKTMMRHFVHQMSFAFYIPFVLNQSLDML